MPHSPRRTPTQARGQATIEVLLEATARVLVDEGPAAATTNRIARRAGVSIGALYHYFPSREALLLGVAERLHERQVTAMGAALAGGGDVTIRALVAAAVASMRVDAELARVLILHGPPEGREALDRRWKQRLTELLATRLQEETVRPQRVELAAWLLVRAVFAVVRDALVERPELVHGDALVEELAELVRRYLAVAG